MRPLLDVKLFFFDVPFNTMEDKLKLVLIFNYIADVSTVETEQLQCFVHYSV